MIRINQSVPTFFKIRSINVADKHYDGDCENRAKVESIGFIFQPSLVKFRELPFIMFCVILNKVYLFLFKNVLLKHFRSLMDAGILKTSFFINASLKVVHSFLYFFIFVVVSIVHDYFFDFSYEKLHGVFVHVIPLWLHFAFVELLGRPF